MTPQGVRPRSAVRGAAAVVSGEGLEGETRQFLAKEGRTAEALRLVYCARSGDSGNSWAVSGRYELGGPSTGRAAGGPIMGDSVPLRRNGVEAAPRTTSPGG